MFTQNERAQVYNIHTLINVINKSLKVVIALYNINTKDYKYNK